MGKTIFNLPIVIILVLLCFFVSITSNAFADDETHYVGDEACADCHDELAQAFIQNTHNIYAESKGVLCESCHGSGTAHSEEGDADLIYNPATEFDATEQNACLSCHNSSNFESLEGDAHHQLANGCSDCHTVHGTSNQLLKKDKSHLCVGCHTDVYAELTLPSRHPVKEGLMNCDDCHNVHGGSTKHTMTNESREVCLSCHSSQEGPFVFEHDPVAEDCQICHTPHGSVVDNLLIESEPALCLTCHPMHFHSTLTGYDGAFQATPYYPERSGISTKDAWKRGMLTKCTQCHVKVHGSDLPSQSIGSGALTR